MKITTNGREATVRHHTVPSPATPQHRPARLVIGISGATGIRYGVRALELIGDIAETHLVISKAAAATIALEYPDGIDAVRDRAHAVHSVGDIGATIASGSFPVDGMLIAPCAGRTLAAIAHGLSDNLLTRAAEVTLKERRRLVILYRETPFTLAHLRNMTAVTEMGGIVMPPVPAFYLEPTSVDDIVDHTVIRALDLLGFPAADAPRWDGITSPRHP
ncbi:MAG TPA: UbiX family flavin prenyltransferase [Rariglobus sp.]